MKIRIGFISNSSSSSFILLKNKLTSEQLEKIRDHKNCGEDYAHNNFWSCKQDTNDIIEYYTYMDNFDFITYLKDIVKIPEEAWVSGGRD
jgi:hypothetical protein